MSKEIKLRKNTNFLEQKLIKGQDIVLVGGRWREAFISADKDELLTISVRYLSPYIPQHIFENRRKLKEGVYQGARKTKEPYLISGKTFDEYTDIVIETGLFNP